MKLVLIVNPKASKVKPARAVQAEIATELGISQMHVSRLLAKSLSALREASA